MVDSEELYRCFTAAETELQLFELEWKGIPLWELARYEVFQQAAQSKKIWDDFQATKSRSLRTRLAAAPTTLRYVHRWFVPYRRVDVLLYGHPRRKPAPNGEWIDIYADPVREELTRRGLSAQLVEQKFGDSVAHFRPAYADAVRYLGIGPF